MSGYGGNSYPGGDNISSNGNQQKKTSKELAKESLKGLGMAALSAGKLVYRGGKWVTKKVESVVDDHKSKSNKGGSGGGSG
eukprot:jgi/Galph1/5408/GphlegSOOS_G4054.1